MRTFGARRNVLLSKKKCDIINGMTIREYIAGYAPRYRGHTPGHKGRLDARDITEILDEFPGDLIRADERAAAYVYGARELRFLTGGSSMGIKAAVLTLGEGFVTDGYCHRAVTEAAELAGVEAFKLPLCVGADGLPALPTPEVVANEMRNRGVRNALIQYPDYYGRVCDLEGISRAVRAAGGRLICDGAHGAHFAFRPDLFPKSATRIADACNLSAHKTLSALTQTAFLAFGERFDAESMDRSLALLGTTSPNYVLLASLEEAMERGMTRAADYDRLVAFSARLKADLPHAANADPTRLVLDAGRSHGRATAYAFADRGVVPEKYDDRYVIFILTPDDTDEGLAALEESARALLGKGPGRRER